MAVAPANAALIFKILFSTVGSDQPLFQRIPRKITELLPAGFSLDELYNLVRQQVSWPERQRFYQHFYANSDTWFDESKRLIQDLFTRYRSSLTDGEKEKIRQAAEFLLVETPSGKLFYSMPPSFLNLLDQNGIISEAKNIFLEVIHNNLTPAELVDFYKKLYGNRIASYLLSLANHKPYDLIKLLLFTPTESGKLFKSLNSDFYVTLQRTRSWYDLRSSLMGSLEGSDLLAFFRKMYSDEEVVRYINNELYSNPTVVYKLLFATTEDGELFYRKLTPFQISTLKNNVNWRNLADITLTIDSEELHTFYRLCYPNAGELAQFALSLMQNRKERILKMDESYFLLPLVPMHL